MLVETITCPACGEFIREFEPDIVLRKIGGSEKRFYHVRCGDEARRIVAAEGHGVWGLTYRRLFWDVGRGAA
jgi:hypothetical protein